MTTTKSVLVALVIAATSIEAREVPKFNFGSNIAKVRKVEKLKPQLADPQLIGGMGGLGPAWTRGGMEAPLGEKNMGTWTAAVYTEEQQARLGVDEMGDVLPMEAQVDESSEVITGEGGLGPQWTRTQIEPPQGEKDMGGWTASVYTEEQQSRLGVTEMGDALPSSDVNGVKPSS